MSERIPSDPNPLPEMDLGIGYRIIGTAIEVGGAILRHLRWEPRPAASDHYRPEIYSMTDQQVMDEWRAQGVGDRDDWFKQDLVPEVEGQIKFEYDSEGSYHHFE